MTIIFVSIQTLATITYSKFKSSNENWRGEIREEEWRDEKFTTTRDEIEVQENILLEILQENKLLGTKS